MAQERVYFKGLDTLRAIGALSVVIGHIELSKSGQGIPNLLHWPYFKHTSGHMGVILFYTLSGFLITYLLLREKTAFGDIDIRRFYIRRALRIWPIYYLMVALLMVLPFVVDFPYYGKPDMDNIKGLLPSLAIYLLMVPNMMSFGIPGIGAGFHLGTIGTEEQFYLFWPWLMKFVRRSAIPMVFILFGIALTPHFTDYLAFNHAQAGSTLHTVLKQFTSFFSYFKISCMAMGGLFALALFKEHRPMLSILYHPLIQCLALAGGFGGWLSGWHLPYFTDEVYALFFAVILINTAANPKSLLSFDYRLTNWLGSISYGIYVYHWAVIYLLMDLLMVLDLAPWQFNVLLYAGALVIVIVLSHLSYRYFERPFLRLKDRFTLVRSYQTPR